MKAINSVCASVVFLLAVVASMNAQPADPFFGTWKLNVAKSTYSPGPAPQSGGATFSAAPSGFKAVIDIVSAKGEKTRWEYSASYDGKEYPMTANPNGDMIAVKRVNANTVETTFKRAGKTTLTNTRTVSADGKTMTVMTTGTNAQGQTVHDMLVYEKG